MAFVVKKAVRQEVYTKTALMGVSGSGKTYSALRMATGMSNTLKSMGKPYKVLMGNTEASRGLYYANEFDYDIVDLTAPFTPEMYVDFIDFAVKNGYGVLIIDSASPEWDECLKMQQQAGGNYQAWSRITPRHDRFIHAIADSPIHIITTLRAKDVYEMDKDDKGKTTVKKLGLGGKQREGFEYEFTCTFLLDQKTNTADVQKDNTHLFENDGAVMLTERHGEKVIEWANSDKGYTAPARVTQIPTPEKAKGASIPVEELVERIDNLAKTLGEAGVPKSKIAEIVKANFEIDGKRSANYNAIKDAVVAQNVINGLEALIEG